MANADFNCFKDLASKFLDEEIAVNERTSRFLGVSSVSSLVIADDSSGKLLNKPFRGISKAIQTHISELQSLTTNLGDSISGAVKDSLGDIITFFKRGPNALTDLVDSNLTALLSIFSTNPAFAYGSSKRASKHTARQCKSRIDTTNKILALMDKIRQVRSVLIAQPGAFSTDPRDAAELSVNDLTVAQGIVQIVSSDLDTNPANRKLFTYDRALEKISSAIDFLKIGANNFKVAEYMKLRLDLKVEIAKFVQYDIDIDSGITNYGKTEQDLIDNQGKVGTIESSYIKELLAKLKQLIDNMNEVLSRTSEELVLDMFLEWTQEAVNIYSLAHQVFDREIQNAVSNSSNPDKQAYTATKAVYEGVDSKAEDSLLFDLQGLPDMYFYYLLGRFTEAEVRAVEDSVRAGLLDLVQADQTIVSTDSTFNPTEIVIIGTLLAFAQRSGLDQVADAILTGNLGGLFSSLTSSSNSKAANMAQCLGSSVNLIGDLQSRIQVQQVNSTIQNIHKNRQLAGSTREHSFKKSKEALKERNRQLQLQKEKLTSIVV